MRLLYVASVAAKRVILLNVKVAHFLKMQIRAEIIEKYPFILQIKCLILWNSKTSQIRLNQFCVVSN